MTKMTDQEFVAGDRVWPTLERLAGHCRGPKRVASAFLGDRAGELIGLGEGDVLVVALSEANAKNGTVSPHEVRRLQQRGVEVFAEEKLHAKVYLFGDVLAVGSSNLSSNSRSNLEEALLVSHDQRAVAAAARWFEKLCATLVTPEWLEICESVYKPPVGGRRGPGRTPTAGRLWLVGVSEMDFPEDEQEDREAGEIEAEKSVDSGYCVETLRFRRPSLFVREVKRGDLVIQAWRHGRGRQVYPHARVLETQWTQSSRGTDILYVYLELPIDPDTITWSAFKRAMSKAGMQLGRDVGTREIRARAAVAMAKELTRN